jgi:four helix bundle protein
VTVIALVADILVLVPYPEVGMKVQRHTDLVAWQRAMDLITECHRVASKIHSNRAFWLEDQLLKAASSVPANIAEGHGRYSAGAYRNHLSIAAGSLREVETHLEAAVRLEILTSDEIKPALAVSDHVGRLLWGLRNAMRNWRPETPDA